jgi:hypothetical protein
MRRLAVVPAVLLAISLVAACHPKPASSGLLFEGRWSATDPTDGSALHLRIVEESSSRGKVFLIHGSDSAPGYSCEDESRLEGLGVFEAEYQLSITAVTWCLLDSPRIIHYHSSLRYADSTDTLTDAAGIVYRRQRFLLW